MKIKIDKNRLTDAPYSEASKQAFYFEEKDETVSQLILALTHARPSAYLISGYRGTGKTSLLNRVFIGLQNSHLCVTINLARYDGYSRLVKQLIRQLYLSYETSLFAKDQDDVNKRFRLLYDRTFHDIVNSKLTQSKEENKVEHKMELNWKKVVPFFFIALGALGLAFNIAPNVINFLSVAGGVIWGAISVWTTSGKHSDSDVVSEDLSWKSLYDDEIAEYHLFGILKELKLKNIKVLLAFDELDKLETKEEISKLINDLKPLLLSGLTNSFVIAGQSLFYNYEKSAYQDDQVISTLFSKMVHVPFLKNAALKKFCFGMVMDDTPEHQQLSDLFFDALILKSSRIPRKLVNLISDRLHWDKDQAFIVVAEEDEPKLATASKLLGVLAGVMDRDLPPLIENPVQLDFFIFQLHLWLFKIQKTTGYFTISSIINDEFYQQLPDSYKTRLREVADVLTDGLLGAKFLKLKFNDDPEYTEDEFLWVESPVVYTTGEEPGEDDEPPVIAVDGPDNTPDLTLNNKELEQPVFLMQYGDLEAYLNELYYSVGPNVANTANHPLNVWEMVNRLADMSILKKTWYKSNKIQGLVNTRNKLAHGEALAAKELDVLAKSAFEFSRLRSEINEEFTYYITRKTLPAYKFYEANGAGYDFMAESDDHMLGFEVKTSVTGKPDDRDLNEILDKFNNINQLASKKSYYILFYYTPERRKAFDEFYDEFYKRVTQAGFTHKDRMHLFYISQTNERSVRAVIEDSLQALMAHINRSAPN